MRRGAVAAAAWFLLLAVIVTWPLSLHLTTHIPGHGAGDNVTFLWNFWWMRQALESPSHDVFHTTAIFHPLGTSLILHTHTAFNAWLGATVLSGVSIVTAQNLLVIASLAASGFFASLLAWRLTAHRAAAVLAGTYFAASPYFGGHLQGHFNLVAAWPLPLFALLWLRALEQASMRPSVAAGIVLTLTAYLDYYYLVYLGAFVAVTLACRCLDLAVLRGEASRRMPTLVDRALAWSCVSLVGATILLHVTGGGVFHIGPVRVRATTGLNMLSAAWVLFGAWAWRRWRPRLRVSLASEATPRADILHLARVAGVFVLGALPLVAGLWRLWMQDDYVSQRYLWRSAPEGIDPVSLIAGNPFHPLWGWIVQRIYDAASINAVESTAWMGPVAAIVLIVTRRDWLVRPGARLWVTVAAAFGIWALGPYLRVFGRHTGLYLPEVLLRYVPIVANARIPGRAIVMVYLAVAMLLAIAVASSWLGKRKAVVAALGVFVLADFQPALPLFRVTIPPVHAELSSMPAGGVIDVPLGIRDGFGERGRLDHRTLYYQSAHGRPIVGGFVARMPGSVRQMFEEAPTLDVLLRLSEGEELDADYVEATRGQVVPFRADRGIRYLVFNHERASPMLREFILSLPLIPLRSEGEWQLYEVADQ